MAWQGTGTTNSVYRTSSKNTRKCVSTITISSTTHKLYESERTTTIVYPGLTYARANEIITSSTNITDSMYYTNWTVGGITFINAQRNGSRKHAELVRTHDSRGYKAVLTTTVISSYTN
jgi:hypothetical protein